MMSSDEIPGGTVPHQILGFNAYSEHGERCSYETLRWCVWSDGDEGKNPLTPLWLVVDASTLFALMLMAHFLHHTHGHLVSSSL